MFFWINGVRRRTSNQNWVKIRPRSRDIRHLRGQKSRKSRENAKNNRAQIFCLSQDINNGGIDDGQMHNEHTVDVDSISTEAAMNDFIENRNQPFSFPARSKWNKNVLAYDIIRQPLESMTCSLCLSDINDFNGDICTGWIECKLHLNGIIYHKYGL